MKKIKGKIINKQHTPLEWAAIWIDTAERDLENGDRVDAIDSLRMAIHSIQKSIRGVK